MGQKPIITFPLVESETEQENRNENMKIKICLTESV